MPGFAGPEGTDDSLTSGVEPSPSEIVAALRDLSVLAGSNVVGKELRERMVALAQSLFRADAVALWRFESREDIWRIADQTGLSEQFSSLAVPASAQRSPAEAVPSARLIPDVRLWPMVDERRALYESEGIVSYLLLPLNIRGETGGTISCYYRSSRATISSLELDAAAAFGEIASVALSTERYDQLADVARDVAGRLDVQAVVQRITDAATTLTGAQFGAFFYNMIGEDGEAYTLYTISGVPREAFAKFPMPRNTEVFAPTFAGKSIVRSPNILKDPRYGKNPPHHGMPAGHLPVVSYLAVPVKSRTGEVLGGLFFGHSAEGVFGETEEKIAEALAGHAATSIDNARLYERLERDRVSLRNEERRYRSLVLATPTRQAIVINSADGNMVQDSSSWRGITGQSAGEIAGRGWLDAVHPNQRERVARAWDASLASSALFEEEYLLRQADGSYRWFASKAVPVIGDQGAVEEWIATAVDVHDQHVAREGLEFLARASELFASSLDYRETLKNVTHLAVPRIADWCAIDMIDPENDTRRERLAIAHADPAKVKLAEEFARKYPPDPNNDSIHRVVVSGSSELIPFIPDDVLAAAAKNHEHLQMMRDIGVMSVMIVPLRSRGEIIGTVTFVASERRFTKQDLANAEELATRASIAIENARLYSAAQAANRAKDEFLATLSHELRTPMTAVMGWSRLLKMGLSPEETDVAIDAIEQGASAQAQLIEDVLDVSRIMSGKLTFDPHPVDLRTIAQAAVTTVHPAALARGIEIVVNAPTLLPKIAGDEGRLQQIIWNLLANAIKFTPRSGMVTLTIVEQAATVRVTVSDTGEGIDRFFLPYVFEPFRQADNSPTRPHGGIGLGLAIVRSLVELHGGRISAESEGKGLGAVFTVEFPVMETAPAEVADSGITPSPIPAASRPLPSLDRVRLLVIDDQSYTRDVVVAILSRAGALVSAAGSVREGLAVFESERPDVVVCDIAMPERDGYAFLNDVRARADGLRDRPIVALTAFGRPEDRSHALDAGFSAYLKKPVDPAELADCVKRLAGQAGAATKV